MSPQPEHITTEQTLRVEGLGVTVGAHRRAAVRDVSFTVGRGEAVGLVGESGSGKTLTCRSVLGLLPPGVEIAGGRVRLGSGADEVDLTAARRRTWDKVRGVRLGRGLPGPGVLPQPLADGRPPARRGAAHPARPGPRPGPRAQRRAVHRGRAARPGPGLPPVPARALGRHAPTRPDRHRGVAGARAAHRRRGDDRPRRGRAGRDPAAAVAAPAHPRAVAAAGHPRPGRRRRHLRPGAGDVRRGDRRERPDRAGARATRGTRTPGRCWPWRPSATGAAGRSR